MGGEMRGVFTIANLTFREAIREKIFYNLVVFALLFIAVGAEASYFVIGDWERIVKDISLSSIEIFGVLIATFLGVGLIAREVEKRTVYTVLSKPISRASYVLGRYIGLLMILAVNSLLMLCALLAALWFARSPVELATIEAFVLIFFQFMLIAGFAVLFSSFTTQTLGAIICLTLYIIGHLSADLKYFMSEKFSISLRALSKSVYYALPNLELLNLKPQATYGITSEWSYILYASLYGLLYTSALLTITILIFNKRDLK